MHHEQEVQLIAYHMWEEQGHPHGHDLEHWLKAQAVWEDKQGHAAPPVQHEAVPHKAASAIHVKEAKTQPRPPAR